MSSALLIHNPLAARTSVAALRSICKVFKSAGFAVASPKATMYLWIPLPVEGSSAAFANQLLEREAVAVMPGSAFGEAGEGYFRIALTVGTDRLEEAGKRLERVLSVTGGHGGRA